jgi:T-complex protein 1 subunit delta
VEISKSQDIEAGDGTTSVVVIAGALLKACQTLLDKGLHASAISQGLQVALDKAMEVIDDMSVPVDLNDRDSLIQNAITSLSSKVVSQNADILAPLAVDCVMKIIDKEKDTNADLRDIFVGKVVGGTVDDTEMIDGCVLVSKKASTSAGGPTRMENAKIGLIQFQLSAPKTDMESSVVVHEYTAMDRILKEEKKYIVRMIKQIVKAGCNVLLIQKSIMRDAVNDLALHFLAKKNIMVVKDVERETVDFISRTTGCIPVASVEQFTAEKLGQAELVVDDRSCHCVRITGCPAPAEGSKTVSVLVRGSNQLILDEAERSLHDALCVVRALVKKRSLVPGGAAVEMEIAQKLMVHSREIFGIDSYCVKAFAQALEIIPYTLAENAGLDPVKFVTELRNAHTKGKKNAGVNVKKNKISDMLDLKVVQPSLVSVSALTLATECVRMILKIDDIVLTI